MKFSIRDLFLVTVIVALALGWWVDRSRLSQENDRRQRAESQWHTSATSLADELKAYGLKVEIGSNANGLRGQYNGLLLCPLLQHQPQSCLRNKKSAHAPTCTTSRPRKSLTSACPLWHATSPALCSNLHFPPLRIPP